MKLLAVVVLVLLVALILSPLRGRLQPVQPEDDRTAAEQDDRSLRAAESQGRRHSASPSEFDEPLAASTTGDLRVRVLDKANGDGLAAVGISISAADGEELSSATNEGGVASFAGISTGMTVVHSQTGGVRRVEVTGGALAEVEFRVQRNPLHGVVVDESGTPLPHARIWISALGRRDMGLWVATCDAGGAFELPFVQPMRYVGAELKGYLPSDTYYTGVGYPGDELDLVLVCASCDAGDVGLVESSSGLPIEGAAVTVTPRERTRPAGEEGERAPPRGRRHTTDALGTFSLVPWQELDCVVIVQAAGFATQRSEQVVGDGLVIRLRTEATLSGSADVRAGDAVVRCVIRQDETVVQNVTCKLAGTPQYRFSGLQGGEADITLEREGQVLDHGRLYLREGQHHTLDLGAGGFPALLGRLSLEGSSPSGVSVLIAPLDVRRVAGAQKTVTGAEGTFSIEGLLPGRYVLQFRGGAWGRSPFHWQEVSVPLAERLEIDLTTEQRPSATIAGRIVAASGAESELRGAVVRAVVVRASGLAIIEARATPGSGEFELGPLAPHRGYRLSVQFNAGESVQEIGTYSPLPCEHMYIDPVQLKDP